MALLAEHTLGGVIKALGSVLLPSILDRILFEVGVTLGRNVATQPLTPHSPSSSLTPDHFVRCINWLQTQWGWDITAATGKDHSIEIFTKTCPFDSIAQSDRPLCRVEMGVLAGIADELFGYGKVAFDQLHGETRGNFCFTVFTKRTPQSLAAHGLTCPSPRSEELSRIDSDQARDSFAQLTARERQILALLAEGCSDKEIAKALGLSVRTVEGHLARIRGKTALSSRSALIRFALHTHAK